MQAQLDVAPLGTGLWGVDAQYDIVRATFTDGTNVPRIPPRRLGGGVYWRDDHWFTRVGLLHAFAQNNPGENETPTTGYDLLRAELAYRKKLNPLYHGMSEIAFGIVEVPTCSTTMCATPSRSRSDPAAEPSRRCRRRTQFPRTQRAAGRSAGPDSLPGARDRRGRDPAARTGRALIARKTGWARCRRRINRCGFGARAGHARGAHDRRDPGGPAFPRPPGAPPPGRGRDCTFGHGVRSARLYRKRFHRAHLRSEAMDTPSIRGRSFWELAQPTS